MTSQPRFVSTSLTAWEDTCGVSNDVNDEPVSRVE